MSPPGDVGYEGGGGEYAGLWGPMDGGVVGDGEGGVVHHHLQPPPRCLGA